MSFAATAAVIGAGSAIYMGAQQRKRANAIRKNAQDPGIQPNYALDRVSNTLFERYNNYQLPGYNNYVAQIQGNMASANTAATQAATSSGDVIDAVTRNQFAADQALNNLTTASASGREAALMQYLQSVQAQGQDQVRVNQQQLNRYDRTLDEAAALEGASIQNTNQGFQDALVGAGALAGNFLPRTTISPTTGQAIKLPSVWQTWRNRNQ